MRGSSPFQKVQKGSSGASPRMPGPDAPAGGAYTKSTSQSEQRVNPCRYSALHCGQYIARRGPFRTQGYTFLDSFKGHFLLRTEGNIFPIDFPVQSAILNPV